MSLTRHILISSGQLMLANALARVLGLASLPVLTHWLSPSAYGQAALASTLISLVSVVGLMGMDMSYSRSYLSRDPPNGVAVETMLWRIACLAALASGMVGATVWLLHANRDAGAMPGLAALVFAGGTGSLLLAMAQTRSRLHNRHGRLAVAVASGGVLATATSLLLAWHAAPDERALVAGYVAAYVVPVAIMGIPGLAQLSKPSGLAANARTAVFLVGLPGVMTAPMYWVLSSADRWFLQASVDSATLGVYAVACTFGQLGMMVNSALLAIWLPEATRVHESSGRNEGDQQIGVLFTRLMLVMILVWLGVAITGGDILRWLTDERFHRGADLVPWLASAVFFYGMYHLANTGLFLGRRLAWSAVVWAVAACVSLLANALLIPRFGTFAAASTQCATFALLALAVWPLSQRVHPLPLPTRRIVIALAFSLLALHCASHLPAVGNWTSAGIKFAYLVAACTAVLWILVPDLLESTWRRRAAVGP